jgi:hypothetical protein
MNNRQRQAGQSTREMADKRYKRRVWFVMGTMGVVLLLLLAAYNSKALQMGSFGFIGLLVAARLIMDYSDVKTKRMIKEERRAIRGARGEEKIGSLLENLGEDYLVIHDVASPYGNIDHIVIGKESGIFLLETKAHGGRVSVKEGRLLVNGHDPEKDFIAQALHNTYWLREKTRLVMNMEPWITPVLVFTNAFVERTAPVKGVVIVNKKFLLTILQRSNTKAQTKVIWENRERIREGLSAQKDHRSIGRSFHYLESGNPW